MFRENKARTVDCVGWESGEWLDGQAQGLIRCEGKEEEAIRNKCHVCGAAEWLEISLTDGGTEAEEVQDKESLMYTWHLPVNNQGQVNPLDCCGEWKRDTVKDTEDFWATLRSYMRLEILRVAPVFAAAHILSSNPFPTP